MSSHRRGVHNGAHTRNPGQGNRESTAKFTSRIRQAGKFLTIPQYGFRERNRSPLHRSPRFGSAGWRVVLSVYTEEQTDWGPQLTTSPWPVPARAPPLASSVVPLPRGGGALENVTWGPLRECSQAGSRPATSSTQRQCGRVPPVDIVVQAQWTSFPVGYEHRG